ncbi:MAG: hypothetical protein V1884_04795 [Candidatus Omnitrophota bacterium]
MSEKIKSPIAIFIVLILVSLSLAGTGFYLLQQEKAKNTELQQQVDDLAIKQKVSETKLEEYKKTISQMELKSKASQDKIDSLAADLKAESAEKEKALDDVKKLTADLERQRRLSSDLDTKLVQAQDDVEKTQAQIKVLEGKRAQLEIKIKELETQTQKLNVQGGVDLGTVVVSPEGTPSAQTQKSKGLEGKILVVNKEYNFVVINLGSRDGVNANDIFSVYNNSNYIGDVKVSKAHDAMSAADFLSSDTKNQISEGDRVAQKTE